MAEGQRLLQAGGFAPPPRRPVHRPPALAARRPPPPPPSAAQTMSNLSWQFAQDEKGNVVKSTYDDDSYTTKLDKSKLSAAQIAQAERMASEIESVRAQRRRQHAMPAPDGPPARNPSARATPSRLCFAGCRSAFSTTTCATTTPMTRNTTNTTKRTTRTTRRPRCAQLPWEILLRCSCGVPCLGAGLGLGWAWGWAGLWLAWGWAGLGWGGVGGGGGGGGGAVSLLLAQGLIRSQGAS
eukprot:SAG22_NODE_4402_length_1281_cov_2.555838_1_plen_238_part_10